MATEAEDISAPVDERLIVAVSCRCSCRRCRYRHAMIDEHEDNGLPRWSDPPSSIHKALGWGCLAVLLVPILVIIYVVAMFCENCS